MHLHPMKSQNVFSYNIFINEDIAFNVIMCHVEFAHCNSTNIHFLNSVNVLFYIIQNSWEFKNPTYQSNSGT